MTLVWRKEDILAWRGESLEEYLEHSKTKSLRFKYSSVFPRLWVGINSIQCMRDGRKDAHRSAPTSHSRFASDIAATMTDSARSPVARGHGQPNLWVATVPEIGRFTKDVSISIEDLWIDEWFGNSYAINCCSSFIKPYHPERQQLPRARRRAERFNLPRNQGFVSDESALPKIWT
jgi:hypothetical protein